MSVSDVQSRLLTIDAVAERLGVSRRTVERKIAAGEIPALQLGGRRSPIRIDERELEAWLYGNPKDAS
jgi:excisionase family DNA binding protein